MCRLTWPAAECADPLLAAQSQPQPLAACWSPFWPSLSWAKLRRPTSWSVGLKICLRHADTVSLLAASSPLSDCLPPSPPFELEAEVQQIDGAIGWLCPARRSHEPARQCVPRTSRRPRPRPTFLGRRRKDTCGADRSVIYLNGYGCHPGRARLKPIGHFGCA